MISLLLEDDGVGFDLKSGRYVTSGVGLLGMRERIEILGGKLTVESSPGNGTRLLAKLPIT